MRVTLYRPMTTVGGVTGVRFMNCLDVSSQAEIYQRVGLRAENFTIEEKEEYNPFREPEEVPVKKRKKTGRSNAHETGGRSDRLTAATRPGRDVPTPEVCENPNCDRELNGERHTVRESYDDEEQNCTRFVCSRCKSYFDRRRNEQGVLPASERIAFPDSHFWWNTDVRRGRPRKDGTTGPRK
ncbi:hypothetical protein IAU60_003839 [Kwoniella sp. DSM 27419]